MHGLALSVAVISLLVTAAPPATSSQKARQSIGAAAGRALQGDVAAAIKLLRAVPIAELSAKERALRECALSRFDVRSDGSLDLTLPAFPARTLGIYRAYWRSSLLSPARRSEEEERLRRNLVRLVQAPTQLPIDELEPLIAERLKADGFYSLMGRTPPLRELMLWRKQDVQIFEVALPEERISTTVYLLDDFQSLGWSGFATCDRSATAGWVRPEALFAVRPRYGSLNDEIFHVSFLAHESQHFADLTRFGKLEPWELEFRAKLTELALAESSSAALIASFTANQSDDPSIPHSHANKLVIAALTKRLGGKTSDTLHSEPAGNVRRQAEAELRDDSLRRSSK